MVKLILRSILLVCRRRLLTLFRCLMGHKCGPVISDLLISALEFWCLIIFDKQATDAGGRIGVGVEKESINFIRIFSSEEDEAADQLV